MDSVSRDWISDLICVCFEEPAGANLTEPIARHFQLSTRVSILLPEGRQSTMQNFDASHANFRIYYYPPVRE
jgi:hypothetical protein